MTTCLDGNLLVHPRRYLFRRHARLAVALTRALARLEHGLVALDLRAGRRRACHSGHHSTARCPPKKQGWRQELVRAGGQATAP